MASSDPVRQRKASPTRPGRPRSDSDVPALSRERILHAALALIDARGLGDFSIRELSSSLHVAPAAIYWHVPSRDALIAGAIGIALEGVASELSNGSWQLRLASLFRRFRLALHRHPALAPAVASQLAYNANFDAQLLDQVVAALEDARFEGDALIDAFNVVIAAMCGFATLELSTAPCGDGAQWEAACRSQIDGIDTLSHPHIGRHAAMLSNRTFQLRWSSGMERPLDASFEAWIDVVLRGLEARGRAIRRSPGCR